MKIHTWKMFQFLILVTLCIQGKADFTCFSSSSPEAKDITLVFDKHQDMTNLWERNPSAEALGLCDSSMFSSSKSSVCLQDSARPETVLLVLWNLTGREELRMRSENGKLFFNKIDCPRPEPISTTGAVTKPKSNNQRERIGIYIFLGCFITVPLLLLIGWLAWKRQKSQQSPVDGSNGVSFDSANSSALINTPRNGSVAYTITSYPKQQLSC